MSQQKARYRVLTFNPSTYAMKTDFLVAACDEEVLTMALERFADHRWEIFEGRRLVATNGAPEPLVTRKHALGG